MKHFWTVWKTQFRQNSGLSYMKYLYRTNRRALLGRLLFFPLIILAIFPVLKLITNMYSVLFNTLHPMGQDAVIFAAAFVFAQSLSFVFGLFYLMSTFYFAKDVDLLIPLPLKPSVILGSKFLIVVISEYAITLPIVVPALWVYSQTDPGWGFWLLATLITSLLPIIPLALASIFVILLMRITNVRKGRGLLRGFGAFLGIIFYGGFQWFQMRFTPGDPQSLNNLIAQPDSLVHLITKRFPPSLWAAEGLLQFPGGMGLYYTGIYFLATAAALIFVFVLADRFFYKGLLGGNEVSVKRKKLMSAPGMFKARPPFVALFLREWRNLVRSASFLMPVLINFIILPVAILIPVISDSNKSSLNLAVVGQDPSARQIIILVASGLIMFISANNGLASTAISREGKSFWVSKIIPVSPFVQVLSKLAAASLVPLMLIAMTLAGEIIFLHFSASELFSQMILALSGSLLTMSFGLFIDLLHPKLDWTDPQQVMKRNLTVLISIFSTLAFVGLSGGFLYWLAANFTLSPSTIVKLITVIYILLLGLMLWLINNRAEKLYSNIKP